MSNNKGKRVQNFVIPLVVYPYHVMISVGESDTELIKRVKKYGVTKEDLVSGMALDFIEHGRFSMLPGNQMLIRVREYNSTPDWYGTLQHELFHCVEFFMRKLRMELHDHSGEAYAYLIQYLTTEAYKSLS